mgnify:CR=1 FL=1
MKTKNISRAFQLIQFFFWSLVIFLSFALIYHIISFYNFQTDLDFFRERERNLDNPLWKFAVYLHVTGGMLCLLSAIPTFIPFVLRHYPYFHTIMGKIYVIVVLGAVVPSGLYLSFYSDATVYLGIWAEIRFLLLGTALFYTTWKAYVLITKGEVHAHCDWMIRSYALALVTLTFRTLVTINSNLFHIESSRNVLFSLWISLALNILLAEAVIKWKSWGNRLYI